MNTLTDTELLKAMLSITDKSYEYIMYSVSEMYEDKYKLTGLYAYVEFRTWWHLCANTANKSFVDSLFLSGDQYMLHIRDEKGDQFVYGREHIIRYYASYIAKRLMGLGFNSALFQIINHKSTNHVTSKR